MSTFLLLQKRQLGRSLLAKKDPVVKQIAISNAALLQAISTVLLFDKYLENN